MTFIISVYAERSNIRITDRGLSRLNFPNKIVDGPPGLCYSKRISLRKS
jgi:hypothetical protein